MIPDKSYKPNGCKVAIRNNNSVIALRYSYNGKQIDLSLGFMDKKDWVNVFKSNQSKSSKVTVTSEKEDPQDNTTNNENIINDSWVNIATEELFSGYWISLNGVLYQFNGQYYEEIEDGIVKQKINYWCANYIDDKGKKSKASPSSVKNLYEWVNQRFYISPSKINCEGIPVKNGYLALVKDKNNKPKFELRNYSHDVYFTYQSQVNYAMRPKKGELKADPIFKHHKNFLVNDVVPALLNLLIDAFGDVYQNGINYQESESYFNEVIDDNRHLHIIIITKNWYNFINF